MASPASPSEVGWRGRTRSWRRVRVTGVRLVAVGGAAVAVVGAWIISPRFGVGGPSLIDDWFAISSTGSQLHHVLELLNPDAQRFRPGWVAWGYVQWHTLGAPTSMIGPNIWALARLALCIVGLSTFALVAVRAREDVRSDRRLLALVLLPPLVFVTVPGFGVDFARFGPQEPLQVGGMTLGGSLLYLGARELIASPVRLRPVLLTGTGYVLWLVGVYQKETSLCVLVLAPFLFPPRPLVRLLRQLERRTRRLLLVLLVVTTAPLLHIAVEVVRIVHRGDLIYGAHLQRGGIGTTWQSYERAGKYLASPVVWWLLLAITIGFLLSCLRGRPQWPLVGLVLTAAVLMAWAAQTGVAETRYYIPALALLAVGLSIALATTPRAVFTALSLAFVILAGVTAVRAHDRVRSWADNEDQEVAFVDAVAAARATGCPVVATGLDSERAAALPVLSGLRLHRLGRCSGNTAYVVRGPEQSVDHSLLLCDESTQTTAGAWYLATGRAVLLRCPHPTDQQTALAVRQRLR